jgi:hypothetical protein
VNRAEERKKFNESTSLKFCRRENGAGQKKFCSLESLSGVSLPGASAAVPEAFSQLNYAFI